MITTDPIADMITRIRNANVIKKPKVWIPHSKMKLAIAQTLEREGFIRSFTEQEKDGFKWIRITLKYVDGEPVIRGLKRISKPGRRVYNGYQEVPMRTPQLGITILSTSKGIMTQREAKKQKVGGEILCEIY